MNFDPAEAVLLSRCIGDVALVGQDKELDLVDSLFVEQLQSEAPPPPGQVVFRQRLYPHVPTAFAQLGMRCLLNPIPQLSCTADPPSFAALFSVSSGFTAGRHGRAMASVQRSIREDDSLCGSECQPVGLFIIAHSIPTRFRISPWVIVSH